jgi:hypothetical protein
MGCAFLVIRRNRNGKHFLSSESWNKILGNILTDPNKLCASFGDAAVQAGGRTPDYVYHAPRANSWPGPELTSRKGNPRAHDILDRLGLLEHEKTKISDLESCGYSADHQSNSHDASVIIRPHYSLREIEQSPDSRSEDSASPPRTSLQQHLGLQTNDLGPNVDAWRPQSTRSLLFPAQCITERLPTAFRAEPYPSVTTPFLSTLHIVQSVEVTNRSAVEYPAAWWYGDCQIIHETPHLNIIPIDLTSGPALSGFISSDAPDQGLFLVEHTCERL